MGRLDDALAEERRALDLDPVSLMINAEVADIYYYRRSYDQAIQQYRQTLDLDPNFPYAHAHLGRAYVVSGNARAAVQELDLARQLEPRPWILASLGYALASDGRSAEALRIIEDLKARAAKEYVSPLAVSEIYLALGRKAAAIDWLEKAVQERTDFVVLLNVDPIFDGLRETPGFQRLVRRIGLPSPRR
jgi:tetratricopeptide (TPR) repeat protein